MVLFPFLMMSLFPELKIRIAYAHKYVNPLERF